MTFRERLVHVIVGLADTQVAHFDAADLFYRLVDSCCDLLDVEQAGLLVRDGSGALRVVAASSEATHLVELLELENEGGPGLEAFRSGETVTSGALHGHRARQRWPVFALAASAAGFQSITALPLRLREQVLGALNLYRARTGPLSRDDLAVARALADVTTIAVLQERALSDDRKVIAQLQTALETRVVIEQAKGVLAQEFGVAMDEAFARIRRYARQTNQRLRSVAESIVAGDLSADVLAPPK